MANLGITIEDFNLSILLYADDIVLIAEKEIELQKMLNIMNDWCIKWRLTINLEKTQIVHFRKPSTCQSDYAFYFGQSLLSYSATYKYLGFVFQENMRFSVGRRVLGESAGRALGSVVNKMKVCPDLSFPIFTRLYDFMVAPVLFYAAGVWGFMESPECNSVQHRALRCFLGVHRFAPKVAVEGDMGWEPCVVRQRVEVIRLWNRFGEPT